MGEFNKDTWLARIGRAVTLVRVNVIGLSDLPMNSPATWSPAPYGFGEIGVKYDISIYLHYYLFILNN